ARERLVVGASAFTGAVVPRQVDAGRRSGGSNTEHGRDHTHTEKPTLHERNLRFEQTSSPLRGTRLAEHSSPSVDSSARAVVPGRKGDGVKEYRWTRILQLISAPSNHSTSCTLHRHRQLGPLGQTPKPAQDRAYPVPCRGHVRSVPDPECEMHGTHRGGKSTSGGRSTRPPDEALRTTWD